jgi:hypothetical protein
MGKILFLFALTVVLSSCKTKVNRNDCDDFIANQTDANFEIYNYILKDSTNFPLFPEDKFSDIKYIFDTTIKWDESRFIISDNDRLQYKLSPNTEELNPYNHTYLFSTFENLISEKEKEALCCIAQSIRPYKIETSFKTLKKINRAKQFKGICLEVTQPIYSKDKKFIFLEMFIHKNDELKLYDSTTYYSKVGLIYEKQKDKAWKQVFKKPWLML